MTFIADVPAPDIDYKALSPLLSVVGGSIVVLMVGLFSSRYVRQVIVPLLTAASLLIALGLTVWIWEPGDTRLASVSSARRAAASEAAICVSIRVIDASSGSAMCGACST